MFEIIKNVDLIYHVKEYDVVLIGTSIKNSLGDGFQHKVGRSFPYVIEANNKTRYNDKSKLGTVNVVGENPVFCLCYIHCGRYRPDLYPDVVSYEALEKCLDLINWNFKGKRIASTIIGGNEFEGGGNPERCLEIMRNTLKDCDVSVYDYKQIPFRDEDNHKYMSIVEMRTRGEITSEEYLKRKKRFLWEKKYGLYKQMEE